MGCGNVKQLRTGLAFKAHRLSCHSSLGLGVYRRRRSFGCGRVDAPQWMRGASPTFGLRISDEKTFNPKLSGDEVH